MGTKQAFRVVFICTDNVSRSVIAEYCLRDYLQRHRIDGFSVASAGTNAASDTSSFSMAHLAELRRLGIDASGHRRTQLTGEMTRDADLLIAMADNHQDWIREHCGLEVPLFSELSSGEAVSIRVLPPGPGTGRDQTLIAVTRAIHEAIPYLARELLSRVDHARQGRPLKDDNEHAG